MALTNAAVMATALTAILQRLPGNSARRQRERLLRALSALGPRYNGRGDAFSRHYRSARSRVRTAQARLPDCDPLCAAGNEVRSHSRRRRIRVTPDAAAALGMQWRRRLDAIGPPAYRVLTVPWAIATEK